MVREWTADVVSFSEPPKHAPFDKLSLHGFANRVEWAHVETNEPSEALFGRLDGVLHRSSSWLRDCTMSVPNDMNSSGKLCSDQGGLLRASFSAAIPLESE